VNLRVLPDAAAVGRMAADEIAAAAGATRDRPFCLALAGGHTPRVTYGELARRAVDWDSVRIFWSDERCVPPDHPASNYRLARETLLDRVPVPPENVFRMPGELEPEAGANAYEDTLRGEAHEGGRLDLVLLGIGEDGHTASLFPGSQALESGRLVAVGRAPDGVEPRDRLTLTLPAIAAARRVLVLAAGPSKRPVLSRLRREGAGSLLPIARVRAGSVAFLADAEAAGNEAREP
jgi:6-phosphogluconolactonase